MKKSLFIMALFCGVALISTSGCIYTHIQRPLDKDYTQTQIGEKEGKASAKSFLWLFAWGDAGTKAAAKNGDIKVINHADTEVFSLLFGLYTRITTVVYGD